MVVENYLPLAGALLLLGAILMTRLSERADQILTKLSLAVFGRYLTYRGPRPDLERLLQSAYMGSPYRVYAAKSMAYGAIAAVAGSVIGVYLASGVLITLAEFAGGAALASAPIPPGIVSQLRSIPTLSTTELFSLLLLSSATFGLFLGILTYQLRWWIPELIADSRSRRIDLSMPRTIALMYALSRGGLALPQILEILERHEEVYGESAKEMAVAGKAIEVFGMDTVSAIRHVSDRTPSDQFRIFTENLNSILQSGRSMPDFLSEQYDQYQEEAEVQQEMFLDRLGAIAEGYVALFVVGPLFLITILLIFGLISGGTQTSMETIIYLLVPLLNLGFMYYLDNAMQPIDVPDHQIEAEEPSNASELAAGIPHGSHSNESPIADGGLAGEGLASRANLERIVVSDKINTFRAAAANPLDNIRSNPTIVLYASVPVAVLWILVRGLLLNYQDALSLSSIDGAVVQALFVVFIPFAVARYFYTNRLREIERVVPDMFNRLASLNESGVEIVHALREIKKGDLGILTPEMQRVWRDIEYGMDVEQALKRLERRTKAPNIRRAVTLITNAMKASGNIGPVLRIAADESRRLNSLRRKRETDMSIYLIITYLSFIVFLTIIFVLVETFIPVIPSRDVLEGSGLAGAAAGITPQQAETFTMLLFHASVIQATFSGLIAGQMSRGSIQDGAIHVVVLLGLAYVLFSVI